MVGNRQGGSTRLTEDDDDKGDGGCLIFGEDGNGFIRGVFLRGCTGLPLQHTRHSPLVSW